MRVKKGIYNKLINEISMPPPEMGGILGMKNKVVSEMYIDTTNMCMDKALYIPDVERLNNVIEVWDKQKISFAGIFHSHMNEEKLSKADIEYISKVMDCLPENMYEMFFPVVLPERKAVFYKVTKEMEIVCEKIELIK
jgi:hypothetical protein